MSKKQTVNNRYVICSNCSVCLADCQIGRFGLVTVQAVALSNLALMT
jgi:hypothetical protein